MPRWLPWTLAGVVLLGLLLWTTVLRTERIHVKTVFVEKGRVVSTVTNTKAGTVRARWRAKLSPQMGGRVTAIAHREGDWVRTGELLIQLDGSSQQAQLKLTRQSVVAVEARFRESCIQRDRAKRALERKRGLGSKNIVSADIIDELESAYEAARSSCEAVGAEVSKARAQVEVAEVEIE